MPTTERFNLGRVLTRCAWWLYPLLLGAALAGPRLFGERWPADTPFYQAIATQMARDGGSTWWAPMQGDLHYFNKPPLAFWAHGVMVRLFGEAIWAGHAPEALWYLLTCLLVAWLGRRLHGSLTGVLAGCVMALTNEWLWRIGNFRLEFLHTLLLLAACACWVEAFVSRSSSEGVIGDSPPVSARQEIHWCILAGLCIGLDLMTKPLIGLGLPLLGLAWLAATKMLTKRSAALVLMGGVVGALVALPWHLSMILTYRESFWGMYFWEQSVRRATGEMGDPRPWDFYFQLAVGNIVEAKDPWSMWPIYILAIAGLALIANRLRSAAMRPGDALAAIWTVVWFGSLSIFAGKRNYYLLIVHPGTAWLAAIALAAMIRRIARDRSERSIARAANISATFALIACLVFGAIYPRTMSAWTRQQLPPDQQALTDYLKSVARSDVERRREGVPSEVYNCGLSYMDAAMIYLKTGIWPRSLVEKQPVAPEQVPSGAIMIFREDQPSPPRWPIGTDLNDPMGARFSSDSRSYLVVRKP